MAIRYSGDCVIRLKFDDASDSYHGSIIVKGDDQKIRASWRFDGLRLAPIDRDRFAVDSSEAYDRAACSALGFAWGWCEFDELGNGLDGGPSRAAGDEIGNSRNTCESENGCYTLTRVFRRHENRWNERGGYAHE